MNSDSCLLNTETKESKNLFDKLLESGLKGEHFPELSKFPDTGQGSVNDVPYIQVKPKPGFCVKLKDKDECKLFFNVCHSDLVPQTIDLADDELVRVLESDDMSQFRIPMCLGEPHAEVDKSGVGCTVYDIIVHSDFLSKMQANELFRTFFLTVSIEGVEEKYKCQIKRDWIILKNRQYVGNLLEQTVRTKSKPLIVNMNDSSPEYQPGSNITSLIQEIDGSTCHPQENLTQEPKFRIKREPSKGHPEFLVADIDLPLVKMANSLTLDVGEDRILLQARSTVYRLDIYLPYDVIQEDVGAQFNRKTKVLSITMPVQPCLDA